MARFIPDPKSKSGDHFIDQEDKSSGKLYQRLVEVYSKNPNIREYAIKFGGVEIVFYPEKTIYEVGRRDRPRRRKVLLSGTTIVGNLEVTTIHSRVVAVEQKSQSNIFIPCKQTWDGN
jgi:hypothetical protein